MLNCFVCQRFVNIDHIQYLIFIMYKYDQKVIYICPVDKAEYVWLNAA